MKQKPTDKEKELLRKLVDHYDKEDSSIRETQIREWRKLKLLWDGFEKIWWSEVAHDWRIWKDSDNDDQGAYDKPVNVFRAYLESIIAALSVTVPPITCYPDDADNSLDLATAKAGNKISKLIYRHNDAPLLWLHALYIYCTEGMVAAYRYTKSDKKYGTYDKKEEKTTKEVHEISTCPECSAQISDKLIDANYVPPSDEIECPECGEQVNPLTEQKELEVTRLIGTTKEAKSRQIIDIYGGLYVKIPSHAKEQEDCPYLIFSYDTDYTFARDTYPDIRDKIGPKGNSADEIEERYGRANPQYGVELPENSVVIRNSWFRPSACEIFDKEDCKYLKEKYPDGIKVVMVDSEFAESENESLDDCWTLMKDPLSDFLHTNPLGSRLVSLQEVTNDLISLIIQTIEHGITQTFADPAVISFGGYGQLEALPGRITSATPRTGKSLSDAFHEVKTSSLSGEILPFFQKVQELLQLVSGATPSIFGGQLSGSKTASEYSMSRAQALQRLQNVWKMFTSWWKIIFSKVILAYIETVYEDERYVQKDSFGNFINIFIRKAELEGKIGNIELEANENLPITWGQQRDIIMQLLQSNNPQILAMLAIPENLPLIYEAIGIDEFYVMGEDARNKQNDEIKQLLASEPLQVPPTPEEELAALAAGMPPPEPHEESSIEVDPIFDYHDIEFETTRKWITGDAGQLAKTQNQNGYRNVLLHGVMHKQMMAPPAMPGAEPPLANQPPSAEVPITGDENVPQVQ